MGKQDRPLKFLEILLKNLIPFEDQENLVGDFREMFDRIRQEKGNSVAKIWYIFQVSKLIPSYFKNYLYWSTTMLRNYVKIAFRNMKKYKSYSLINIAGLAIGMACCILIFLFIQGELSYDRYHEKRDRIYRLVDSFDVEGGLSRHYALSSAPFAPTMKKEFPEVEDTVRFFPGRRRLVKYEENKYYEDGLFFADGSVFNIFTFPLVHGNPEQALTDPNTIVISERIAQKYFGNENPMNRTLIINDQNFLVTGIMQEIPPHSHFHADMFASLKTQENIPAVQERYFQNWARHEFYTYLLLKEGASADGLQNKLPAFIEKHAADQIKSILGGSLSSRLQPLQRIHLYSHLQMEISPNGDIKYITIFSLIALFILMIGCFNFMNLTAARSVNRSSEVGMRKVVGASRSQLVRQFLGESMMFTSLSLLLAVVFVKLSLPFFNSLTGKDISFSALASVNLIGSLLFIFLFVGIVSGSYPAFFVSRYQPVNVLKGSGSVRSSKSFLRKGSVILQFSISIVLIISTTIVIRQLDFLRNKKLGFEKEHVVVIPIREHAIRKNAETIKAELQQNPNILNATIAIGVPGGVVAGDAIQLVTEEGKKTLTLRMIYTDHDYIETMGMEIVEGRDFSKDMSTDSTSAFVINEAAVRHLGLKNPLDTRFEWGDKRGKVIGVVKDFQFQSLREEINPLVIHISPQNTIVFAMRISPTDMPATLGFLENKWRELDPAHPFEYTFMDESFDKIYKSEEKLSQMFGLFSLLAISIASLGLFGLALFMVEQKTKEIGVRKVLGASLGNIFILVSKEFIFLVLLANVFAWPVAYYLMRKWLQHFAYQVKMELWIFLLSGAVALLIALITVSYQALKAAVTDPVRSLRYE
jgi:putative ABC transport system permease protein